MTEFELLTAIADADGYTDRIALLNGYRRKERNAADRRITSMKKRGLVSYDLNDDTRLKLSTAGYDRLAELEVIDAKEKSEFNRRFIISCISFGALLSSVAALLVSIFS